MKITYLDIDTREVLAIVDDPALEIYEIKAEKFAASVGASVVTIIPSDKEGEWIVKLKKTA